MRLEHLKQDRDSIVDHGSVHHTVHKYTKPDIGAKYLCDIILLVTVTVTGVPALVFCNISQCHRSDTW